MGMDEIDENMNENDEINADKIIKEVEENEKMQTAETEQEKQNENGYGFMNKFFKKQPQKENEKEPVYTEYIRKFSAFSFFDNDKDNPTTATIRPKLNGL